MQGPDPARHFGHVLVFGFDLVGSGMPHSRRAVWMEWNWVYSLLKTTHSAA